MTASSTAARPPASTNRYIVVSPLNSTPFPAPLLIGYSIALEEEGTENGCGYNQEDTGEEPRGRRLRRVRVAAAELAVGLDAAHQTEHGADGVTQLGGGVEIRGHEARRLVDARKPLALCKSTGGGKCAHHRKKDSFLHRRIV